MRKQSLLCSFLPLIFACSGSQEDPNQLNLSATADIKGFDPAHSVDVTSGQIVAWVYDNLVQFGDSTEIVPGIAESWELSEDRLTYTFKLHEGFRFQSGREITAGDVKFSLERVVDPKTRSPQTWLFDRIRGAKVFMRGDADAVSGISLPNGENGYTVKITLKEPFSPFIQFLAMPAASIVDRHAVESGSVDLRTAPSGSGPWKLEEWVRDGHLLFSPNKDYFYGAPRTKRLKVRIISEEMTEAAEFEAGNLDMMQIPAGEFETWIDNPKWKGLIQSQQELNIYYVGLNCSRPPFNDPRVRQAMNYAVDRDKILQFILSGRGILAHGSIPPGLPGYDPHRHSYAYDPNKTRELLAEAGYPDGFSIDLWQSQASELAQIMEAFQAYWKVVGIEVRLVKNDWNVFKTAIREGKPDAYYLDWYADYPDGENFLFPLFHSSESMTKRNRYSNPQVDRLIEKIQMMPESQERVDLLKKVDEMIYKDAPWVFLWHSTSHVVVQPWIRDYSTKLMFNAQKYLNIRKEAIPPAP